MTQRFFNHDDPIIIAQATPAEVLDYLDGKNDDLTGDFHTVARHLCIDCAAITSSDLSRASLVIPDVRAWTSYEDKKVLHRAIRACWTNGEISLFRAKTRRPSAYPV